MGQKYGPQDVVRLKKEVTLLTEEVSALLSQRDSLKSELARILSEIGDARSSFATLRASFEKQIHELGDGIRFLENKMADIERSHQIETQKLMRLRGIKNATATSIKALAAKKPDEFVGVCESLSERVSALQSRKQAIEAEIQSVDGARNGRAQELSDVNKQIEQANSQLQEIISNIKSKLSELSNIETQYASLYDRIRVTLQREHDIRIMHQRMTEKYQSIYGTIHRRA